MKVKLIKTNVSNYLLVFLLLIASHAISAQDVPVFGWKSHFSYNNIPYVTASNDRLYAASTLAVFFIDQEDQSINLLNKNTGLTDLNISAMESKLNSSLVAIGYQNGTIDLINANQITSIDDILVAENLQEKRINSFLFENDFLWISSDFGIVKYDLNEEVILESYQNIGQNGSRVVIHDLVIRNDSIYAASEDGILSVSLDDQTNRQDFNFWNRQLTGIPFHEIAQNNVGLVASSGADLFTYSNGQWVFTTNLSNQIEDLKALPNAFYLLTENALYNFTTGNLNDVVQADSNQKFLSLSISNDQLLIGTATHGLLIFDSINNEPEQVLPQGPASDQHILSIDSANRFFWLSDAHVSQFNPNENLWSSRDLVIKNSPDRIIEANDLIKSRNTVVSSFDQGPFIATAEGFEHISSFSPTNSLNTINGAYNLASLQTDEEQNVWFVQYDLNPQLHSWNQQDDSWESFRLAHPQADHLSGLFIIDNGDKWMTVDDNRGGGVLVFNESSNLERYLNINGGQGGLPGSLVNDVAQDEDRYIWVATDEGICFFALPEQILTSTPLTATIPIFDGSFLLRDEHITKIAIDPANRKWFGTLDNGVWLFSETGEELNQHFTAENSPLPSNHILDISIDESSGQIYFTTTKGIASFRSDATVGTPEHQMVKAYPNPVKANFNGPVVIEGLVNNALLRITDTSGKLVRSFQANGSTAIWNIRDEQGNRVSSGVYLVFSSNSDGTETFVGKIVVI